MDTRHFDKFTNHSEITEHLDHSKLLTKMGSKQSSTTADEINTKTNENTNENIGIFNISGESLTSGNGINLLEVLTCVVVFGGAFVYIRQVCARRRKRRLLEMSAHLQEAAIMPAAIPQVAPSVARLPVMGPPGPPGYQLNVMGQADKYDI